MARPKAEARDLLVAPFYEGTSWGTLDLATSPLDPRPGEPDVDLATATGPNALRQALLLRLLTPEGSLSPLGHAAYGSRLHELVGELNVPATRQLARSYTLRCLLADRRVEAVLELNVAEPTVDAPNTVAIRALVKARHIEDPIELGVEVAL